MQSLNSQLCFLADGNVADMRRRESLSRIGLAFLTFPALYFLMILVQIAALYVQGGVSAFVREDRLYFSRGAISGVSVPYITLIFLGICTVLFLTCMYSLVTEVLGRKNVAL